MSKLRLGPLADDKPVRLTVDLTVGTHRDLFAYAQVFASEMGQSAEPVRLFTPMLARFMEGDRAFTKARRASVPPVVGRRSESA